MKRLFIILAFIVMSLTMNAQVELKGGLLNRSDVETEETGLFIKQSTKNDANTKDTDVPVGSGLMLIGFGTAYALYKRNKQ